MAFFNISGGYRANTDVLAELSEVAPEQVAESLNPMRDEYYDNREACISRIRELLPPYISDNDIQAISDRMRRYRFNRLLKLARTVRDFYAPTSAVVPSLLNYISISPLILPLRQRTRFFWFAITRRARGQAVVDAIQNANTSGFTHNFKQMLDFSWGHRNRTERIMNALKIIGGWDFQKSRILCVGPRNESEVLLLRGHGFHKSHIEAIDLFSYSPCIRVMDMNNLDYADDHFDIYYSSAVIKYSPDILRTVSEAIRVTRGGGLMVFGFMYGMKSDIVPEGSGLEAGVRELLDLFEAHVDHIYWHDEYVVAEDDVRAAVIFRLRK